MRAGRSSSGCSGLAAKRCRQDRAHPSRSREPGAKRQAVATERLDASLLASGSQSPCSPLSRLLFLTLPSASQPSHARATSSSGVSGSAAAVPVGHARPGADLRAAGRERRPDALRQAARRGRPGVRRRRRRGLPHDLPSRRTDGVRPSAVGRRHRRARGGARRPRRAGARGHPGGIGLQPARPLAEGRDGPDAADAGHRGRPRRPQSLRSRTEHPRRRRLPALAARSVQRQRGAGARRLQRRPGRGDALRRRRCRPIARPATTCRRCSRRTGRRGRSPATSSTACSRWSTARKSSATPTSSRSRASSRSCRRAAPSSAAARRATVGAQLH